MKNFTRILFGKFFPRTYAERLFTKVYLNNQWAYGQQESSSGHGSTELATRKARNFIEEIVREYKIESINDAPCGDFNWFSLIRLPPYVQYTGFDIVKKIINQNRYSHSNEKRVFVHFDLVANSSIIKADLTICREFFQHISLSDALRVLKNIKMSGCKYLLSTSYPEVRVNKKIENKLIGSRPINLLLPPFNMGLPLRRIIDGMDNNYDGRKELSLWQL